MSSVDPIKVRIIHTTESQGSKKAKSQDYIEFGGHPDQRVPLCKMIWSKPSDRSVFRKWRGVAVIKVIDNNGNEGWAECRIKELGQILSPQAKLKSKVKDEIDATTQKLKSKVKDGIDATTQTVSGSGTKESEKPLSDRRAAQLKEASKFFEQGKKSLESGVPHSFEPFIQAVNKAREVMKSKNPLASRKAAKQEAEIIKYLKDSWQKGIIKQPTEGFFNLFEDFANQGDMEALNIIFATKVKNKQPKALQCAEKLAKEFDVQAFISLCEMGKEVVKDKIPNLFSLYESQAKKGDPRALACLGYCYEKGFGKAAQLSPEKRKELALQCYKSAAEKGNVYSMEAYTRVCEYGTNMPAFFQSILGLDRAVQKNVPGAEAAKSRCYTKIETQQQRDIESFLKSLQKAEGRDPDSDAMLEVGMAYLHGNLIPSDPKEAYKWLLKAAKEGNPYAIRELHDGFKKRIFTKNSKDLRQLFLTLMARKPLTPGLNICLGVCYEHGLGTRVSSNIARFHYIEGAREKNPLGLILYGDFFKNLKSEEAEQENNKRKALALYIEARRVSVEKNQDFEDLELNEWIGELAEPEGGYVGVQPAKLTDCF